MALSMHEQRMLSEIEQRLSDDDPRLASVFSRFSAAQCRLAGLRRESPAVTSTVTYPKKRPSSVARSAPGRPWVPWTVLAVGAAILTIGVVVGQVLVALAGSILVAATPLLIPVCTRPRFDPLDAHGSGESRAAPIRRLWWHRTTGSGAGVQGTRSEHGTM